MNSSLNPLSAIQHASPWQYYAQLTRNTPIYFDTTLNLWVVSDAASTEAALNNPHLQVRPASQPVPPGIIGTSAGDVFGQLIRMCEGEYQQQLKAVIMQAFSSMDLTQVRQLAQQHGQRALRDGEGINHWLFSVPAGVVASLCGFMPQGVPDMVALIAEFVLCIPAGATPEQQQRASVAAQRLLDIYAAEIVHAPQGTLLAELLRCANDAGWSRRAPLLANAIGFLSQTYDATAGLIGNTLLIAQQYPDIWKEQPLEAVIAEAVRYTSPIQNTRRFATQTVMLREHKIAPGDAILLLLAAANRDPARFPQPDIFQPARSAQACFAFSGGRHRCPGAAIAQAITHGMVSALDIEMPAWRQNLHLRRYLPSGNARIPEFICSKIN